MIFGLWLRVCALAAFTAFVAWASQEAHAGSVWCVPSLGLSDPTGTRTDLGDGGYTWRKFETTVGTLNGSAFPSSGPMQIRGGVSTVLASGTKCTVGSLHVLMLASDYDTMVDAAAVVTKLQEGFDLVTVGLMVLCLIAGLTLGHKLVQRKDSQ